MAERTIAMVLKTIVREHRGFESRSLRQEPLLIFSSGSVRCLGCNDRVFVGMLEGLHLASFGRIS